MRWIASLAVLCLAAAATACPIRIDVHDPQREELEAARTLVPGHGRRISTLPSDQHLAKRTAAQPMPAVLTRAPELAASTRQLLVSLRAAHLAPAPVRPIAASSRGPPLRAVVALAHLST